MKYALLVVLLAGPVMGYEIPDNPDRKPSFGFNFERYATGGDYTAPPSALTGFRRIQINDAGTWEQNNYKADVRVPINSVLTFNLGGGYTESKLGLAVIDKDERWTMKGYNLAVGFRLYYN